MEHLLPYLLLLACPVSMGAMMWLMMRDKGEKDEDVEKLKRRIEELENDSARSTSEPQSKELVGASRGPKANSG